MASFKELNEIAGGDEQPQPLPLNFDHVTNTGDVFSFLEKGFKETFSTGNRNNYCHTFAADANRFGVNENDCFGYLSRYASTDFTTNEIRQAVRSAYTRSSEHGTKEYNPMSQRKPQAPPLQTVAERKPTTEAGTAPPTLADFEQYRITDKTNIPIPEPLILINGEIITTSDALTVISGASKSGKTALESILISGSITTSTYDGIEGIEVLQNTNRKAVIHLDTEQSRWKHQQKHKTIIQRANFSTCPDYFLSYNIRKLPINQYASFTKTLCDAAKNQFNGVHSIWIDGGADYINDVNDATTSNAIIKFFEGLGTDYSCPVIVILHTNPGGEKERGHFGSQCQRKAEAVLSVKNENDVSYIEAKFLRNAGKGDVPQLQFVFDKSKGYHVGCGTREKKQVDKSQKNIEKIKKYCSDVFSGQNSFAYGDAITKIMGVASVQQRTAKDYFQMMTAANLIIQGDDKLWRKV
jgi:hypothetical protein